MTQKFYNGIKNFKYTDEMLQFLKKSRKTSDWKTVTKNFNEKFHLEKSQWTLRCVCSENKINIQNKYDENLVNFIKENIHGKSYPELTKLINEKFGLKKRVESIKRWCSKHNLTNGRYKNYKYKKSYKNFKYEIILFIKENINSVNYRDMMNMVNEKFNMNLTYQEIKDLCKIKKMFNNLRLKDKKGIWRSRERVLWEEQNGDLPDDSCIIHADGNKRNFSPENLVMVKKTERAYMGKRQWRFTNAHLNRSALLLTRLMVRNWELRRRRHESKN